MRSVLRLLVKALALLILLVVVGVGLLLALDVPVSLDRFKDNINRQLSTALKRNVSIDGDIVLVTGTTPTLRVEQVTVGNPRNWEGDGNLASVDLLQTSIGLSELLHMEIDINDITVAGLELSIEETADGRTNWEGLTGSDDAEPEPEPEPEVEDPAAQEGVQLSFTGLDFITVTDVVVTRKIAGGEAEPVFALSHLNGTALPGVPIQLVVNGHLQELPFEGTLKAGTLEELLAGAHEFPFELETDLRGATLDITGQMSARNFSAPGTLTFTLDVPDVQRLTPLTGPLPISGAVQFAGNALRKFPGHFAIPELNGSIAGAPVTGAVEVIFSKELPRITGEIDVGTIDLAKALDTDAPPQPDQAQAEPSPEESPAGEPAAGSGPDAPVEPAEIAPRPKTILPVAGTFQVRIEEILGLHTTVREVTLDLDVTEETATAEVGVAFAATPLAGQLELGLEPQSGAVSLDLGLNGKDADLTETARMFTDNDRFSGKIDSLRYQIAGEGPSLKEAWDRREVDMEIQQAGVIYRTDAHEWNFLLEKGTMTRKHGSPGEILLSGRISDAAYEMRAVFHLLEDGFKSRFEEISGTVADVEFQIRDPTEKGSPDPYSNLELSLKGDRLDNLDQIYELDLPPLGPYAVSGSLRKTDEETILEDLEVTVGESRLFAEIRLNRTAKQRKITANLNAETIQLDDFTTVGWSPTGGKPASAGGEEPTEKKEEEEEEEEQEKPAETPDPDTSALAEATTPRQLLSYDVLSTVDAEVKLEVGEVLSGNDRLGKANLDVALENGRLEFKPLTLAIPGGQLEASVLFHPKEDRTLDWHVKMNAVRLDFGIVARRLDPDTKLAGILNLDLDVNASGVPFGGIQMNLASGRMALDVCPENLDAGILDLWATNLVLAILPKLDEENQSKLNCIIGRFTLENGVLTPEILGLDTTTIRMTTEGQIDLQGDSIDLTMTPFPKRPQIMSLEIPVGIKGTLHEPEISMGALPVASTLARMAKNIVLFPVKTIASEDLPEDGSDICACAANYAPDPEALGSPLAPPEEEDDE